MIFVIPSLKQQIFINKNDKYFVKNHVKKWTKILNNRGVSALLIQPLPD